MKNFKRATFGLSLLIALLCLCGCGVVTKEDITKAEKLCEPNGGLNKIYVRAVTVQCKNGAEFTFQ